MHASAAISHSAMRRGRILERGDLASREGRRKEREKRKEMRERGRREREDKAVGGHSSAMRFFPRGHVSTG